MRYRSDFATSRDLILDSLPIQHYVDILNIHHLITTKASRLSLEGAAHVLPTGIDSDTDCGCKQ